MLYSASRKNMLGGHQKAEMKAWSLMSATMNDRIAMLTPHYAASMALLAQRYVGTLQGNKDVVGFIKSVGAETKEQAEMDYCVRDIDKEESVASLAVKLEALLKKETTNGTEA